MKNKKIKKIILCSIAIFIYVFVMLSVLNIAYQHGPICYGFCYKSLISCSIALILVLVTGKVFKFIE